MKADTYIAHLGKFRSNGTFPGRDLLDEAIVICGWESSDGTGDSWLGLSLYGKIYEKDFLMAVLNPRLF